VASILQLKRTWKPLNILFATNSDGEIGEFKSTLRIKNMAERRKIIIQTGAAPDEPLPTPHFDAEATMTARPVVPLSDQESQQAHYGNYAGRNAAKPFWKRPALLALIVLVAVGIGVAAGLAIGIYRNRNAAETPIATTPSPTVEDANVGQTVEPPPTPTEQTRAAVPADLPAEEPEETAAEPKVEERERTARNERRDDDDDDEARPPVAAKPPAVVREKKPIKIDEYVIEDGREARQAEKEQRREERRAERRERRRRGREDEMNIPRGVERGRREVDRIREIFEGRQP
jgi:type IV secretory pathway VirB10-like protein